jgi:hypothetical protein
MVWLRPFAEEFLYDGAAGSELGDDDVEAPLAVLAVPQ